MLQILEYGLGPDGIEIGVKFLDLIDKLYTKVPVPLERLGFHCYLTFHQAN